MTHDTAAYLDNFLWGLAFGKLGYALKAAVAARHKRYVFDNTVLNFDMDLFTAYTFGLVNHSNPSCFFVE